MNIEECKKKDGLYYLLQLGDRMSEFELIVNNGKEKIFEVQLKPFKKLEINEKDFDLMCDLHESDKWEKDE